MTQKATFQAPFRRRRQGKTNYSKRLAMVKHDKTRVVIRKTNKHIYIQGIIFQKQVDQTIVSAQSKELVKLGWKSGLKNTPAAYLTGYLFGKKAGKKDLKEGICDIGFRSPVHGSVCFAALKGALDAGISIPFEEKALPKENRLNGEHINKNLREMVAKVKQAIEKEGSKNGGRKEKE